MGKIKVENNAARRVFIQPFNTIRDHVTLAVDDAEATDLTRPSESRMVLLQALEENVRYTLGRTSIPTATTGFVLTAGADPTVIPVEGEDVLLRIIAETAGAMLEYQWLE